MTNPEDANVANAALVALVSGLDTKLDGVVAAQKDLSAAQNEHRREVREDIAGLRRDSVLRTEYDQRIGALETRVSALEQARTDDARAKNIPWTSLATVFLGLVAIFVTIVGLIASH